MRLSAGTMLGPYEVMVPIGAGGMGEVYRARDSRLRRDVALKVLPQPVAGSDIEWERFQREARAASALNHPNICTVLDVGETNGQPYLVMELLEGETLQQRLTRGKLEEAAAVSLAIQIADALAAAHGKGILHRDIKPGNIMLVARDHVKVLDFGLAKQTAGTETDTTVTMAPETVVGSIVGTPAYLAPEILRGERADTRTDVWALGIVLCQMFTGVLPFQGNTTFELSASILKEPLPPLNGISTGSRQIVEGCLAKDRANRTASAEAVRDQLEKLKAAPTITFAAPPPPPQPVPPPPPEKPVRTGRRVWLWVVFGSIFARYGYTSLRKLSEGPPPQLLSTEEPMSPNADANREFELGMTAIRANNDVPSALAAFERAMRIDPKFSPARRNHAFFTVISLWHGFTGDTSLLFEAEQELRQVERDAPDLLALPAAQAAVYFVQGRRELIPLKKLDRTIRDNPDRVESSMWRVVLYDFAEETDDAKDLLQSILDRVPLFGAAQTYQAELQRQGGDAAGAEVALMNILGQAPGNFPGQMSLILAYLDQGKLQPARQLLEQSLKASPKNHLLKTMQALVLASEGKKRQALEALDSDLQTYASAILVVTLVVAEIYAVLGDSDKAIEWVSKAVRGGDERLKYMRRTPRLASIQKDPRFLAILTSLEALHQRR